MRNSVGEEGGGGAQTKGLFADNIIYLCTQASKTGISCYGQEAHLLRMQKEVRARVWG